MLPFHPFDEARPDEGAGQTRARARIGAAREGDIQLMETTTPMSITGLTSSGPRRVIDKYARCALERTWQK